MVTNNEAKPWYRVEIGIGFTAIQVAITGFHYYLGYDYSFKLYTVYKGVETVCGTYIVNAAQGYYNWTVSCSNTGTGFKISASADSTMFKSVLTLCEITADMQI